MLGAVEDGSETAFEVSHAELAVSLVALDGEARDRAYLRENLEGLISQRRQNPEAIYESEARGPRTLRSVVADSAGDLAPYAPNLAGSLRTVVDDDCG